MPVLDRADRRRARPRWWPRQPDGRHRRRRGPERRPPTAGRRLIRDDDTLARAAVDGRRPRPGVGPGRHRARPRSTPAGQPRVGHYGTRRRRQPLAPAGRRATGERVRRDGRGGPRRRRGELDHAGGGGDGRHHRGVPGARVRAGAGGAAVLGTTYLGNAFQSANSVSNVLFELLAAGALSAVLVPTFVELLDAGDRRGAEQVAGGVLRRGPRRPRARSTVVGVLAAPLLAEVLTLGVPADVAGETAGAGHLPAAVLRPPDPAVRGGHGRHRRALRPAPLRGRPRPRRSATRS